MQKKSKETLKKLKSPSLLLYKFSCRAQKSPKNNNKNGPLNRNLLDFFIGMLYAICYMLYATWWIFMSRGFRICMANGGGGCLRLSYRRPKWPNWYGRNFQNIASTKNERLLITYEKLLIHCGCICFLDTSIFLITNRILSPSTEFGRPKHD